MCASRNFDIHKNTVEVDSQNSCLQAYNSCLQAYNSCLQAYNSCLQAYNSCLQAYNSCLQAYMLLLFWASFVHIVQAKIGQAAYMQLMYYIVTDMNISELDQVGHQQSLMITGHQKLHIVV